MLNDRVLPFFESQEVKLLRVLTGTGTEYCGSLQHHEYELYLALENMDHTKTKARSPQTNGITERFHKTILEEFYQVAFRKKIYTSIEQLPADVDEWLEQYNRNVLIQASIALGARLCKLFETPNIWRNKTSLAADGIPPVKKHC